MNAPVPLGEYSWLSEAFPLCTVNVPVAELAQRFGIAVANWQEPGLGSASGFGCRLTSGLVLLLEELSHAREHLGAAGPTIYVEATALLEQGIEATLAGTLTGLHLSPQNIVWSQTESGLQSARNIVQALNERPVGHNGA